MKSPIYRVIHLITYDWFGSIVVNLISFTDRIVGQQHKDYNKDNFTGIQLLDNNLHLLGTHSGVEVLILITNYTTTAMITRVGLDSY